MTGIGLKLLEQNTCRVAMAKDISKEKIEVAINTVSLERQDLVNLEVLEELKLLSWEQQRTNVFYVIHLRRQLWLRTAYMTSGGGGHNGLKGTAVTTAAQRVESGSERHRRKILD